MDSQFLSKIRTIRSKNLRNLLKIYFYTHVEENQENNPVIPKHVREYMQEKPPKILPGLRIIQRFLGCSKTTAQDYLRAVYITHEIFVARAIEKSRKKKPFIRIKRKDYKQLLKDLSYRFAATSTLLGVRMETVRKKIKLSDARKMLMYAVTDIENSSGVFTPQDCAKIIREFASWFA